MNYVYGVGDIIRRNDTWGVVKRVDRIGSMVVDWWVGQAGAPHITGEWCVLHNFRDTLIHTYANNHPYVPDEVLARSMRIILEGNDQ